MLESGTNKFLQSLRIPIVAVVVLWLIHISKILFGLQLYSYGIYPREVDGLKGILFSPLIHGDFEHLIANTVPLFALTFIIYLFYNRVASLSILFIYLLTGLMVWFLAKPAYHIGASGVVYGLLSFVFWSGIFRRNIKSIVLALVVTILYSGYFAGIVPGEEGISWESHLFGGLVGILVAFLFKSVLEDDEELEPNTWPEEREEDKPYLLDRDTFEMTRWEKEQLTKQREQDDRWNNF